MPTLKSFDNIPFSVVAWDREILATAARDIARGQNPDRIRDSIIRMTVKKPELLKSALVQAALWLVS